MLDSAISLNGSKCEWKLRTTVRGTPSLCSEMKRNRILFQTMSIFFATRVLYRTFVKSTLPFSLLLEYKYFNSKSKINWKPKKYLNHYKAPWNEVSISFVLHTVFPQIVSAETILFWIWPYVLWPLVTVDKSAETIQRRKLLKGGNYSRKYGICSLDDKAAI